MESSGEKDTRPEIWLSAEPTDEELKEAFAEGLRYSFHRHSVCIYVEFWLDKEKKDKTKVDRRAFSGVLVDINDQWLVVTAGHCIDLVQRQLAWGCEFKRCYLIDSKDNARLPVAFNWKDCDPWYQFDEKSGADYGALFIGGNTRDLMAAEEKAPMRIGTYEPDHTHFFAIYGWPGFAAQNMEEKMNMTSYTVFVRRTAMPDDLVNEPTVETFFGHKLDSGADFSGLSGAPLFACSKDFPLDPDSEYYLYAIQVWQRGREIGAPLARGFLPLLEQEVARRRRGA